MADEPRDGDVAARALAWRHAQQAAVCDVVEPWQHGTVVRSTRYPSYFDFNLVRVERDPGTDLDALAGFADRALGGLAHRRIDFDVIAAAEPLRAGFEARGWTATRLIWMRNEHPSPAGGAAVVEAVAYDAVSHLRIAWHREDLPLLGFEYLDHAREIALSGDVAVLAVRDGSQLVAYAQLERRGRAAEISLLYVQPSHRGRGLGTALTCAAIEAAGDVEDLWICADDEDRPKELYARLGFRGAVTTMELQLAPVPTAGSGSD